MGNRSVTGHHGYFINFIIQSYAYMLKKILLNLFVLIVVQTACFDVAAKATAINEKKTLDVYRLSYIEREPGTDEYEVTMLVSDRYIRVDEAGESSGFIIYDDKDKVIYSVSHHDRSILVIKEFPFLEKNSPVKANVEYLQLLDAPSVSGESVFNYRVFIEGDKTQDEEGETCAEFQIVENILPKVRRILQNYQKVVSGQQVRMVDNKITEMQGACFYADQIYNTGDYYKKGLPVQEWHSNEHSRLLTSYKKIMVEEKKFSIPKKYRKFSINPTSKIILQ